MKFFILLAILTSIFTLSSCDKDELSWELLTVRNAWSENDFIVKDSIFAKPGELIVVDLEYQMDTIPPLRFDTKIADELGTDIVSLEVPFNANFNYRLDQNTIIEFSLLNDNGTELFKLSPSNLEIKGVNLPPGKYKYKLVSLEDFKDTLYFSRTVFIQPDLDLIQNGNGVKPPAGVQYLEKDLNVLISDRTCRECSFKGGTFPSINTLNSPDFKFNFTNCNFANATLTRGRMNYSDFSGSNFNKANLDSCNMMESVFHNLFNANLARFFQCNMYKSSFLNFDAKFTTFDYCILDLSTMADAKLVSSSFFSVSATTVTLNNADFTSADCSYADFNNTDFSGPTPKFYRAKCDHTIFEYSNLENVDMRYADLNFADFNFCNLRFANLCNSIREYKVNYENALNTEETKCY